jgi:secreted trypsin-like serine protease
MRTQSIAASLFVLFNVACAAQPQDEAGGDQEAIDKGAIDRGDGAVGLVWFQGGGFCTGTLIAPTVVLTAGHCVQDPIDGFYTGTGTATTTITATPVAGLTKHAVAGMAAHPTYAAGGCPNPTLDIGLIHLAKPISNIKAIPVTTSSLALPAVGETLSAVGYGTHTTSSSATYEQKRSGTELFMSSTDTALQVKMGTALADHGDSGGPLLHNGAVIGTTSCHTDGDYPQHQQEYYARVDQGLTWITTQLTAWK